MRTRSGRLLVLPLLTVATVGLAVGCAGEGTSEPMGGAVRIRPDEGAAAVAPAAPPADPAASALAGAAVPPPDADAPAAAEVVMQGPWRVVCVQEDEVVFRHDRIFRVWEPDHEPPQWVYQTADGLRFRGRMGTDLNCMFERIGN